MRGGTGPVRAYVRNLRTGQVRYLASVGELAELLEADSGSGDTAARVDLDASALRAG